MFKIEEARKDNRASLYVSPFATQIAATAMLLIMLVGATEALAASRKIKPAPGNFRVTATTACTVTVAWDPASNISGDFNYYLSGYYGVTSAILPKTATSHTFTGLNPYNDYGFSIYAKDTSGNVFGQASVTTTTLPDTTPPSTAPVVSVTEVGSNYASFAWPPVPDDGCYLYYEVWKNGSLYAKTGKNVTSITIRFLKPATDYAITVRAYDYAYHLGPFSDPITVTTLPANPDDTTPPTTPGVNAYSFGDGSTETQVSWSQSTDDFDVQSNITYYVYLNGVLQEALVGSGGPISVYAEFGENLIEVIARDTAGNASAPGTATIFF
jgi:chitodextrinase